MSAVDRAADVLRSATWHASGSHVLTVVPLDAAQALADAGLLVTDEMRSVLDAATAVKAAWIADDDHLWMDAIVNLLDAVDAYIAVGADQ